MNRKVLLTSLAAALAGAMGLAGCGSSGSNGTVTSCATDGDCASEKEVCLPGAKICVPTCEGDSDCTSNHCMAVDGISSMVCGCTSTSDCGSDTCHTVDGVCEPKCTVDSDCADYSPTRTCNVSLGQCNVGGCNPACTGGQVCAGGVCVTPAECTVGSDCRADLPACVSGVCSACTSDSHCNGRSDSKTRCDVSTGACVLPLVSCDSLAVEPGTNGGPDECNYGEDCVGNRCQGVSNNPQCAGFQNYPYVWDPATPPHGPVIVEVTAVGSSTSDSTRECAGGAPKVTVTARFYAPGGWNHPSSPDMINNVSRGITFIGKQGQTFGPAFIKDLPPNGTKAGTFVAGFCTTSDPGERALFMTANGDTAGNIVCLK
jgi:hypothetical protein